MAPHTLTRRWQQDFPEHLCMSLEKLPVGGCLRADGWSILSTQSVLCRPKSRLTRQTRDPTGRFWVPSKTSIQGIVDIMA